MGQDSCLPEDKNNGEFLICFSYLTGKKKKKQLDFYVKNVLEKYYSACVVCWFLLPFEEGDVIE